MKDEQLAILINLIIKSDLKIIVYTFLDKQTQVKNTNIGISDWGLGIGD
ncbi:MAG: hypothetical protein ACRDBG_10160 [Waterburya sp.]